MATVLPVPRPKISSADIRKKRYAESEENQEFYECVKDIITHPVVLQMKKFYQHCDTDCYEHCLNVAYNNFRICKYMGLDARSAARGGMLHDLFLYDWRHHRRRTGDRLHAITHPIAAYKIPETVKTNTKLKILKNRFKNIDKTFKNIKNSLR